MAEAPVLHLFEGYGVELEYMIVSREGSAVRPIADRLIERECGRIENEIERDGFAWSNELARHVIELKTNGPVDGLGGVAAGFQREIDRIGTLLAEDDCRLMPGGMHPTMDPTREFALWPHGDREIYESFDRIFDCTGHGWANLQSMHLNLPFAGDDEFGRLHAAVRALLPLLPAIAASSPYRDGVLAGDLDARIRVYAGNARKVPSVSGVVVPEPVFTRRDYEALLESIYRDIAPLDPRGVLQHEWLNARGCIARFDRMAVEIRVLDTQECPRADLAIAATVAATLRTLCDPDPRHQARLRGLETGALVRTLWRCVEDGDHAVVDDGALLAALGLSGGSMRADELWSRLVERDLAPSTDAAEHRPAIDHILARGCLARRMRERVGDAPTKASLAELCAALCDCLASGTQLGAEAPRAR
ncbi:MAG TPA: glutamate-cysteine ligase family protein [Myxococcota bacterium]|nr:glutamate-cysteine ligase family protein [Myxococcota bacterium]